MNILDWIGERLGKGKIVALGGSDIAASASEYLGDISIIESACWAAINLIANTISKCEFRTFSGGLEEKGDEYYLWNLSPNRNQNANMFLHKLIATLFQKNEALVIEMDGQLLVADGFNVKKYAIYDYVFSGVAVDGITFSNKTFAQSEVLYFRLGEQSMRQLAAAMYSSYQKLIAYSMTSFQKSRGNKFKYLMGTTQPGSDDQRTAFTNSIQDKIKTFVNAESAVFPLGRGEELSEFGQKVYSPETSRDIRALIDDVVDFVARGFGVPPVLIRGNAQDTAKATEQFLTFCIEPLCRMLQEEINRKRNGPSGYKQGNRLQIDTKAIKHFDLLSSATAIDKLIASGAFSVNDIRALAGEPLINEPWANEHFITRNYMLIQEAISAAKKGAK